jgi:two-component system NarL family sensor kinase
MVNNDIRELILITTLVFLIAPVCIIIYVSIYLKRKKRHIEEKEWMKLAFDAELIKTYLEVQEQTMQTIGTDLHDNIGQLLSLMSLTLNSIEITGDEKAKAKIESAIDLTAQSIKELRQLAKLVQGDQLILLGLSKAIHHEIDWMERSGNYRISYDEGELPKKADPDKDLILFRILQEMLNNIIKHSRADKIDIGLNYLNGILHLHIADNGVGFDTGNLPIEQSGMGLQNIRKRAIIVGGRIELNTTLGKGTIIDIFIPYG